MRIRYGVPIFALVAATPLAHASVIVSHTGNSNPTTEGWTASTTGTAPVLPVNDSGTPAWQITDPSVTDYREYYKLLTSAQLGDPTGWTATADIRAANSTYDSVTPIDNYAVSFTVYDGSNGFVLDIVGTDPNPANDGVWYAAAGTAAPVQLVSMDTASAYHKYQLIFNPATPDRVELFVDGVEDATILRSLAYANPNPSIDYMSWGSLSDMATGASDWNAVSFQTGQVVGALPAVPEPASLSLLALGGMALLRRRRHA